eukprot:CAMPEP_0178725854 /NCGR_PEP_ID=MMETSP0699-20121125/26913_1 /TAXON_ID=265572 /ORGANISM="Extubocellulus spinifer, Strain CCMP396" /LENGTH=82 /DNA_ID=CAMNT_0020377251 /DNA_START=62 /DNA_END=307 /DNA_ORIENTATION=+
MKLALAFAATVATASAFAPSAHKAASRPITALNAEILKKTTGQAALDPNVVAQYAALALPTDKGKLVPALHSGRRWLIVFFF